MKKYFLFFLILVLTSCGTSSEPHVTTSGFLSTQTPLVNQFATSTGSSFSSFTSILRSSSSSPIQHPESRIPNSSWSIPVLMFHHIGSVPNFAKDDQVRKNLTVSTSKLEESLQFIKKLNYMPITFIEMSEFLNAQKQLPEKAIILSFDDGYDDNFSEAMPLLEKYKMKAIFYIIIDKVGTDGYMTWEQIKQLQEKGHEIGSHTRTHPDLAIISGNAQRLQAEVVESKFILAKHGIKNVVSFCYPAGKFNELVTQLVEQNYRFARTTKPGLFTEKSRRGEIGTVRMEEGVDLKGVLK